MTPGRFDPVVLHEIAHVRARDVSWVSAVRWIAWITIPVIALAQFLDFRAGTISRSETGYVVLHAAALVAATVVIAAGLLRRREIEADRLAVQWLGSPEALRRLLDTGGAPAAARECLRRAFQWCLRPLARHPSIAARIRALGDPLGLRDGGFGYALAVGVVAVMAMNASYFIANDLDYATTGYLQDQLAASAGASCSDLASPPCWCAGRCALAAGACRAHGGSRRPEQPSGCCSDRCSSPPHPPHSLSPPRGRLLLCLR